MLTFLASHARASDPSDQAGYPKPDLGGGPCPLLRATAGNQERKFVAYGVSASAEAPFAKLANQEQERNQNLWEKIIESITNPADLVVILIEGLEDILPLLIILKHLDASLRAS